MSRPAAEVGLANRARELIALLGRRDMPTDALEDYCHWLAQGLERQGFRLRVERLPWAERGWLEALSLLWRERSAWRGRWVLVQYTALQWSKRGFPAGLLAAMAVLRWCGARPVLILHDPLAFRLRVNVGPARRTVDRLRGWCQGGVMRGAHHLAVRSVSTLPVPEITWLWRGGKTLFNPVGANIPQCQQCVGEERPDAPSEEEGGQAPGQAAARRPQVAVFGVTTGPLLQRDLDALVGAVASAARAVGPLRLTVFGRGAHQAEAPLRRRLQDVDVELKFLGLLTPEEVSRLLGSADVMLFVRGGVSSRRGSAVAALACGLPIVGYASEETAPPMTEAGVVLVPENDTRALGEALARVLAQPELRQTLRCRTRSVFEKWFHWERVALRMMQHLEAAEAAGVW
ncbi:MAG: glycosyltransferase [Gemmatimonadetes bacterium]|nr:glycosyltransferase [Gemmatimonadota bacterium]